eukprot:scaffold112_cov282-Prasinococcus_capsulatus_cf.AAC.4
MVRPCSSAPTASKGLPLSEFLALLAVSRTTQPAHPERCRCPCPPPLGGARAAWKFGETFHS